MVFLFEFITFVETELMLIFDAMFVFFNTGVLSSLQVVLSPFPGTSVFISAIKNIFPALDIVMWKFILYNFGTILVLSLLNRVFGAIPFV